MSTVLQPLSGTLRAGTTVISVAAGVSLAELREDLGRAKGIRLARVEAALLNEEVERRVLARSQAYAEREGLSSALAQRTARLYRDYLLPISRLIQVHVVLG